MYNIITAVVQTLHHLLAHQTNHFTATWPLRA